MSDVSFEEDSFSQSSSKGGKLLYSRLQRSNQIPALVRRLMQMGVKTEAEANAILVGFVMLLIAASIFIYTNFLGANSSRVPLPAPGAPAPISQQR